MTEQKLDIQISRWVVQALARLSLTFGVILGALIVIGGEPRFSGPSYASALTYPGAPTSWGVAVALFGLLGITASLLGRTRWVSWMLYLCTGWALFFSYSLVQSAIESNTAGLTGPVIYTHFAISAVVLGVAHAKSQA